jgi:predicted nucleic acid-binding Zn ribbon protein
MKKIFHIGEILHKLAEEKPKISTALAEERAADAWCKVVSADVQKNTAAVMVKNGTLYVSASSPSWAQQLSLSKASIISEINKLTGQGETIKDIRFRTGTIGGR